MKLSYATLCNFPTSRRKISDLRPQYLSTSVNIVTSILSSLHSGIRIWLINVLWARGIGRTSGSAGWVLVLSTVTVFVSSWMLFRLLSCRRSLPRRASWLKSEVLCLKSTQTHIQSILIWSVMLNQIRVLFSRCVARVLTIRTPLLSQMNLF